MNTIHRDRFAYTVSIEFISTTFRFHDGPVSCTDADDKECNGILQIYYSVSNETVYSSTVTDHPEEPLGSVWDTDGPAAVEKLNQIHEGLMDLLSPLFEEMGVGDPLGTIAPPSGLLVGVWNRPSLDHPLGYGYTAPTKVYYEPSMSGTPDEVCGVPDLTDAEYRDRALQPWGGIVGKGSSVFLVNNDWVCQNVYYFFGDWAEESLLQAERAMYLLHTPQPIWLDESYYKEKVISQIGHDATLDTVSTTSQRSMAYAATGFAIVALFVWWYKRKFRFRRKEYTTL